MFYDSKVDGIGRELKQIDKQSLPGTFSLSEAQADFAPENFWSPIRATRVQEYCPPKADKYLCRHCHELSYTSCQESDQRVGDWRKMGIDGMLYRMKHGNAHDLFFGLKALPAWLWSGLTD